MKDVAILCEVCSGNGCWDTMWPGSGHDDELVFGVAGIEAGDEDWVVTWLATGLTVAQAEAHLEHMDFPDGTHRMG